MSGEVDSNSRLADSEVASITHLPVLHHTNDPAARMTVLKKTVSMDTICSDATTTATDDLETLASVAGDDDDVEDDERWQYREWQPLDHLTQQIPPKYQSVLTVGELKITCLSVVSEFILVGTNTGSLYWYDMITCRIQRLRVEGQVGSVTRVAAVTSCDHLLASGHVRGHVAVFQLPRLTRGHAPDIVRLTERNIKKSMQFLVCGHHEADISALSWSINAARLFSGDVTGRVVVTDIDYLHEKYHSRVCLVEPSGVVQLNYRSQLLLVATVQRCCLFNFASQSLQQIGCKPRKTCAELGACFAPSCARIDVCNTTADAPTTTSSSNGRVDGALRVLAARASLRMVTSTVQGRVITTVALKRGVLSARRVPVLKPTVRHAPSLALQPLRQLFVLTDTLVAAHNNTHVFIIDTARWCIVRCCDQLPGVLDMTVCGGAIYVLTSHRCVVRLALTADTLHSSDCEVNRSAMSGDLFDLIDDLRSSVPVAQMKSLLSSVGQHLSKGVVHISHRATGKMSPFPTVDGQFSGGVSPPMTRSLYADTNSPTVCGNNNKNNNTTLTQQQQQDQQNVDESESQMAPLVLDGSVALSTRQLSHSASSVCEAVARGVSKQRRRRARVRCHDNQRNHDNTTTLAMTTSVDALSLDSRLSADSVATSASGAGMPDAPSGGHVISGHRLLTRCQGHAAGSSVADTGVADVDECATIAACSELPNAGTEHVVLPDQEGAATADVLSQLSQPLDLAATSSCQQSLRGKELERQVEQREQQLAAMIGLDFAPKINPLPPVSQSRIIVADFNNQKAIVDFPFDQTELGVGDLSHCNSAPSEADNAEYPGISGLAASAQPCPLSPDREAPEVDDYGNLFSDLLRVRDGSQNSDSSSTGFEKGSSCSHREILTDPGQTAREGDESTVTEYHPLASNNHKSLTDNQQSLDCRLQQSTTNPHKSAFEVTRRLSQPDVDQEATSFNNSTLSTPVDVVFSSSLDDGSRLQHHQQIQRQQERQRTSWSSWSVDHITASTSAAVSLSVCDRLAALVTADGRLMLRANTTHAPWSCCHLSAVAETNGSTAPAVRLRQLSLSADGGRVWRLDSDGLAYALVAPVIFVDEDVAMLTGSHWVRAARDVTHISVDDASVWYVKSSGKVCVQRDLAGHRVASPEVTVDTPAPVLHVAACAGVVWACTEQGGVLCRMGVCRSEPAGYCWTQLDCGPLRPVCVFLSGSAQLGFVCDARRRLHVTRGVTANLPRGIDGVWRRVVGTRITGSSGAHKRAPVASYTVCLEGSTAYLLDPTHNAVLTNRQAVTVVRWQLFSVHVDASWLLSRGTARWRQVSAGGMYHRGGQLWTICSRGRLYGGPAHHSQLKNVPLPPKCGSITCVAAAPGRLWVLTSGGEIFVRQGIEQTACGNAWLKLDLTQIESTRLVHISLGSNTVWACSCAGAILVRMGSSVAPPGGHSLHPVWVSLDPPRYDVRFSKVAVSTGDSVVWALDECGQLWRRCGVSARLLAGSHWTVAPALPASAPVSSAAATTTAARLCFEQLAVATSGGEDGNCGDDGEIVWAASVPSGTVYRWMTDTQTWCRVPGSTQHISVSMSGELWAVHDDKLFTLDESIIVPGVAAVAHTQNVASSRQSSDGSAEDWVLVSCT